MPDNEFTDIREDGIYIYAICSAGCVICAALAAGMTVGLLSLDSLKLQIKLEVGTEEEKAAVRKILPLIADHHLLLCTLLLFNALANEALPIFLDALVPSWAAVVISVTLVLLCGEVIPSALFTGPNQLYIASKFTGLVFCLQIFFYPIAYPMGKVLDHLLGHEDDDSFNRDEITALVHILRKKGSQQFTNYFNKSKIDNKFGFSMDSNDVIINRESFSRYPSLQMHMNDGLTSHEVNVITGVLGLNKITCKDICVPLDKVTMLAYEQILDQETIDTIDKVGFSRLPVFINGIRSNIIGYLIVKHLININPEKNIPLKELKLNDPLIIGSHLSLLQTLALFQSSHRHMAIVSDKPKELIKSMNDRTLPSDECKPIGILTVEDVFEKLLLADIIDEEDRDKSNCHNRASEQLRRMSMRYSTEAYYGNSITNPLLDQSDIEIKEDNERYQYNEDNNQSLAYSYLKNKGMMTPTLVSNYRRQQIGSGNNIYNGSNVYESVTLSDDNPV